MEGETAAATVDADHAGRAVADAVVAEFCASGQRGIRTDHRDPAIDHVDRAADRAAAVEQRGRPLEHFDLLGKEGFDAHRMVDADRGHVAGAQPIAQHLHARAVQAADDRPAHAGTEVGGLHARQAGHRFAQRAGLGFVQLAAGQHFHRRGQVLRGIRQRRGVHFHRGKILGHAVMPRLLGRVGSVGGGGQRQCQCSGKCGAGQGGRGAGHGIV